VKVSLQISLCAAALLRLAFAMIIRVFYVLSTVCLLKNVDRSIISCGACLA
jgi:hypothetical protein